MRVGSASFARFYTIQQQLADDRLVSGAVRSAGSMTAKNKTSQRTDVVAVDISNKSNMVRYKDPQALLIDVYV